MLAGVQYFLYHEREDIKYNVNKAVSKSALEVLENVS